jgi:mannose-1-phosphate guanylyltransferase/mannose-6-phosphate isomerase
VAALQALRGEKGDPLLLVLPADHVITDTAALLMAVDVAVRAAAEGRLVTFGVVPTRAETGYGYIRRGADDEGWAVLEQFVEKPDSATAEQYLASGQYLWNSGMFAFSARAYLEELTRHAPGIAEACKRASDAAQTDADFVRLGAALLDCPSDSIDYAVMEKTERAAVVPLDAGWSDVGSWAALHDVLDKDADGNVLRGDVLAEGCKDCYIASHGRLVAGVGLDGIVIVETEDAILVASRAHSQAVKRIVESLEAQGRDDLRHAPAGAKRAE